MNPFDSNTVEELIDAEPDAGSLFDLLGAITATAADAGVEVTVNLEGKLIDLDLAPEALDRGASELAAEIFRLAQQAAGVALSDGLATVAPFAGEDLTEELAEIVGVPRTPPAPACPADDDFSAIETWALPRVDHPRTPS